MSNNRPAAMGRTALAPEDFWMVYAQDPAPGMTPSK
jgi:hypothetical protein